MPRIYHQYQKWEDFQNGMWRTVDPQDLISMLPQTIEFTGDHIKYGLAMMRVIREWPITCEHNLTDNSINQKAFIGHCAVCLQLGIPEYITRMAWKYLSKDQQDKANERAQFAIDTWNLDFTSKKWKCNQITFII
jgi:hypothetical protein